MEMEASSDPKQIEYLKLKAKQRQRIHQKKIYLAQQKSQSENEPPLVRQCQFQWKRIKDFSYTLEQQQQSQSEYFYSLKAQMKDKSAEDLSDPPSIQERIDFKSIKPQIVLYGDIIIDLNSIKNNKKTFNKQFIRRTIHFSKIKRLFEEKQVIFYMECPLEQLIDFSFIIKYIYSFSTPETNSLATLLEYHQKLTNLYIQSSSYSEKPFSLDSRSQIVTLCQDPDEQLLKALKIVSENLGKSCPYFQFDLYIIEPEKNRLNRYFNSSSDLLLDLISEDPQQFLSQCLHGQISQFQGNVIQFVKMSIPFIQNGKLEMNIQIYTLDHYIIPATVTLTEYKLSDRSQNFIMLKTYEIDSKNITELKRVRKIISNSKGLKIQPNSCIKRSPSTLTTINSSQSFDKQQCGDSQDQVETFLQTFDCDSD